MYMRGLFVHANHAGTTPTACLPFQNLQAAEGNQNVELIWITLTDGREWNKSTAYAYLGPNPGFFAFYHDGPRLAQFEYE